MIYIYINLIIIILMHIISMKYLDYKINILNNSERNYNYNISSKDKNKIIDEINNRINLLKNMSYNDWIVYNKNNKIKMIDNVECYTFVWEHSVDKQFGIFDEFISKVYFDENLENIPFDSFLTIINDEINEYNYKLNKNLIKSMFYLNQKNNEVSFYCTEHLKNINKKNKDIIKYNCINQKFTKDNINGVIGIYYYNKNITNYQYFYYFEYINIKEYIFIVFLLLSSIIINININNTNNYLISLIFVYLLNIYLIYFMFKKTAKTNNDSLIFKYNEVNTSTLSIAFLISFNIFIINFISKNKKTKHIYILCIILFSLSVFYLLGSLYKFINYTDQYDIRKILFIKVLLYNLVILTNFYIILIYIFHLII